ncbi:MAG TPA: PEGA domain-containing protein [candidate division Zixibacteria bacterium]|nr:PEGA domain-containing protein [candidate division Zixibacteria bacterium]
MVLKRILAIATIMMTLSSASWCQSPFNSDLTVNSTPPGAQVTLEGEARVAGVTPARFRQLIIGNYQVVVKRQGYETYKTRISVDPTQPMEVNVTLSPKTRFKAAARSLFIPGWGQRYADQKFKGYALTFLAAASVAAYFVTDHDFDIKYDRYMTARHEYDSLLRYGNITELQTSYATLQRRQHDAWDAENLRRVSIGSAIGTWGLSFLDALFFFPNNRSEIFVKGLSVAPSTDPAHVGVQLSFKF